MSYKTITVDVNVDVEVDLDEFEDHELIDEMNMRGYACIQDKEAGFDRDDWDLLLDLIDKAPETVYTRRTREKLLNARHAPK